MHHSPPPSSPPHIEAQGSVMQTTSCQIKFEWIGGMTTILSEWICRELSSFLACMLASRGIVVCQEAVTQFPMQLLPHIALITSEIFHIYAVCFIQKVTGCIQWGYDMSQFSCLHIWIERDTNQVNVKQSLVCLTPEKWRFTVCWGFYRKTPFLTYFFVPSKVNCLFYHPFLKLCTLKDLVTLHLVHGMQRRM